MANKPIDTSGPVSGVPVRRGKPLVHETLPDWWAVLSAGAGGPNTSSSFDPSTLTPVATPLFLPVCFGQVRVTGADIYIQGSDGLTFGQGVTVWSEGEIESIDAVRVAGFSFANRSDSIVTVALNEHVGETGGETNPGGMFGGAQPSFANAAYTHWTIQTAVYWYRWWNYLPGASALPQFPSSAPAIQGQLRWEADLHGLLLYDPRTATTNYSNNPALIVRYLLHRYGNIPDALLDDVGFRAAADACESIGFTCNVAFTEKTLLHDALAVVLQTCNGKVISAGGKTGIYLDAPNAGAPVATLSEEDGDIWGLHYEWISARDRYTRIAVSFLNKDADYKPDQTPDFDDPGIALGSVPIRAEVINAPGINTLDAAIVLRDYLFNSQAITFRASGTMSTKGISLQQGQKIHLTTLKGVDGDFLIEQIAGDSSGFFSFVGKPYDEDVYGTTPISQPPPLVTPPGPNPNDAPNNIVVTDTAGTRTVMIGDGPNQTIYNLCQLIQYTLPTTGPAPKELRARGFNGTGAATKTWDDMSASEIIIPLTGNEPPPDASHYMLSMPGIIKTIRTLTFDAFGRTINTSEATGPTRIIIKTATTTDVLSTGVTVDVAQSSSSVDGGLPVADIGRGVIIEVPPIGVIDGSNPDFTLSHTPSSARILLIADAMPVWGGVDYTRIGPDIHFTSGSNKPFQTLLAVYPYGQPADPDNPEEPPPVPPHGEAAVWTNETSAPEYQYRSVAWSPDLTLFAAIASDSGAQPASSSDGETWAAHTITGYDYAWVSVCWGNGQFVAVNEVSAYKVLISADGLAWASQDVDPPGGPFTGPGQFRAITWAQELGLYVAVRYGSNAGAMDAATVSADGLAWTRQTTPSDYGYYSVCWSPELTLLAAVGENVLMTSPNGTAWTDHSFSGDMRCVIWVAELGLFVGSGYVHSLGPDSSGIWTSPDGVNWTEQVTPGYYGGTTIFQAVVWSPTRHLLVAVSNNDSTHEAPSEYHEVITSPNGVDWTAQPGILGTDQEWYALACGDSIDTIVAVGPSRPAPLAHMMRSLA